MSLETPTQMPGVSDPVTNPDDLVLERRAQKNETPEVAVGGVTLVMTPPISDDYWAYRVRVANGQAVLGFPKYGTIGIGFAVENDWNSNLPYWCGNEEIYKHIAHNRGTPDLSEAVCRRAIELIQAAAHDARGTTPGWTP